MKTKIHYIIFLSLFLILTSFIIFKNKKNQNNDSHSGIDFGKFEINNIRSWFHNNGIFNLDSIHNSGFEWLKDSMKYAKYVSGIWLGAKVGNDTLITHAWYDSQYLPGFIDDNGNPQGKSDPDYRIYSIVRGDTLSPDYLNWPADQGAYTNSIGKPFFLGTQTMFYSFTDGYEDNHNSIPGNTAPLKAQILQTNWAYSNVNLRDVIFTEFRIINRSNMNWNNSYFGVFTDDDIGDAYDDASGIDTNRNLTYTYNFDNYDPFYGNAPPSVGLLLLRSPVKYTGNFNDSVKYFQPPGSTNQIVKPNYKYAGLHAFNISENAFEGPRNYREAVYFFEGRKIDNSNWIDPATNLPTVKPYAGDPVTGSGWVFNHADEMRTFTSLGNITVLPNDTQSIIVAQLIARGSSNLNSITKLKELSDYVQTVYDNNFQDVLAINNESNSLPSEFNLHQNYPNPFNP